MTLIVHVVKANGKKQLFNRNKVVRTCLKMGATKEVAETIAKKIEMELYDRIPTKKILQLIFRELRKHKPITRNLIDLKRALSLIKPAPDFERYIQILLSEHGFEVTPNQIIRGRCVEHEVDAIARKNGETYIVEVKHHYKYHTSTGLDVSRIARAVLEDVTEGYTQGFNNLKITKAMIVCNTKLSNHAKRYVECRGIHHIGWSSPTKLDLQTMIEKKKLYPITYLKGLNTKTQRKLTATGIVTLKQLITEKQEKLGMKTGIPKETLNLIIKKAKAIFSENE